MDATYSPQTSQKADVRPISFALDNLGSLSDPITLPVRPEDLTRNEPARATVHQTLGREPQGWVDHFGEALPSVTIAGHTGWHYVQALGRDGVASFEALNDLIVHQYPAALQRAIDTGRDPSGVKLVFLDLLDNFVWEVVPTQFVLRRSRSRPLLYQYNISLQAISTRITVGLGRVLPNLGSISGGLEALDTVVNDMPTVIKQTAAMLSRPGMLGALQATSGTVLGFVNTAVNVLRAARTSLAGVTGYITGAVSMVIGIAKSISMVGRELFRTLAAIVNIPYAAKLLFTQMATAFNEVVCIFSNSLRLRGIYQQYQALYGASNCSSTTGGRMPSAFSNQNVFAVMNERSPSPVSLSGSAISSVNAVLGSDQVLRPMPGQEMMRHLEAITSGTVLR